MDDDDRRQLSRRLFALLSVRPEDAATLAARGESSDTDPTAARDLANRPNAAGNEVATISDAVCAINAADRMT